MAIEITVPRLGWSMEEGTFSGWLKRDGEAVAAGEPLFAVESDKVTMDVESLDAGVLHVPGGAPEPGSVVRVGQLLGYLLAVGEAAPAASEPVAVSREPERAAEAAPAGGVAAVASDKAAVTPRARRVARELGVDLARVRGSGRNGRIREADVQAAAPAPTTGQRLTPARQTIAARMMESRAATAPVTLTTRADATAIVALRRRGESSRPSYTDIIAKLVATALRSYPALGGRWENGGVVALPARIHIGIAVDTPQGLMVPVLRDVDTAKLPDLAARSRALVDAARSRRLKPEDTGGAAFTITNLGSFGIDEFTPIINYPETAILGLGAVRAEAVVLDNGGIAVRDRITLSLTFDHRLVDGAPAARFLQAVVRLVESPPADL